MTLPSKTIEANGAHPAKIRKLATNPGHCDLSHTYDVKTSWFHTKTGEMMTIVQSFRTYSEARSFFDFA